VNGSKQTIDILERSVFIVARKRVSGYLADFRNFIMRANVVDLAVAVIIAGAFGKIVDSLVTDIITPVLLKPAIERAGVDQLANLQVNGIKYGLFLAAIINYVVIAFVLFLLIRSFEAARRQFAREEAAAPAAPDPIVASNAELTAAVDRLTDTIRSRGV
jgi:large conductance mechanosensitive channel